MADIIELGLKARTIGVDQSAAELDRLTAASDRAEKGAKGMEAASTKAAPAVRKVGQESDGAAPKVRKVGAEADKTGRELKGMGADAEAASRKVGAAGSSIDAAGKSAGANTLLFKNLAYQVNQVGQQGAATGQWMTAMTIQIPDVLASFGSLPLVLAGGAAAVGASLLPALLSGGEAVEDFDERLTDLTASLDAYTAAADAARTPIDQLRNSYGNLADVLERNLTLQEALALAGVNLARNQAVSDLSSRYGALSGPSVADIAGEEGFSTWLSENAYRQGSGPGGGSMTGRSVPPEMRGAVETMRELREEFDLSTAGAVDLASAMQAVAQADTLETQTEAVAGLLEAMVDVAGGTEKARKTFGDFLSDAEELSKKLADQLEAGGSALDRVLDKYAGRTAGINALLADRAVAEIAATQAAEAGNAAAEERARQAVDAIDEQIKAATDADGRLDDMRDTLETLDMVMESIDFDGEGEMREQVEKVRKELKEAGWNADNLGDADLTALEAALRSIAGFAERAAEATGETIESLKEADSLADTYSRYYQGRLASDRIGDAGRPGQITDAAELLRQFEGFIPTPKWDVNALRVGYGSDTITLADGTIRKVTEGMKVSVADANRDLERRIGEFQEGIIREVGVGRWSTFSEGQQAVLTSIAYNYGSIGASGAGIADEVRSGDTLAIVAAIEGLASHNGGINSNRRMTEAQIFAGDTKIDGAGAVLERLDKEQERLAERAATEGERAFDQYRALTASMDEATAAQIRFEDAQETINEALAAGKITAEQAAAARSDAEKRLAADMEDVAEKAQAERDAFDALMGSLDPATAASLRFAEAQETIADALAAGKITAQEAAAATDLARQEMEESIAEANKLADASRTGAEYLGNMMGGILDGSMSAKEALAGLLMELAKVQMMKATMGLAGGGGFIGSAIGALGSALTVPSFDGGGYTGSGPRSGGIDGKGGYPAIVHPGEVIQDLTKGQGGGFGGAITVDARVYVDQDGNWQAKVERISDDTSKRNLKAYDQSMPARVKKIQKDPRAR